MHSRITLPLRFLVVILWSVYLTSSRAVAQTSQQIPTLHVSSDLALVDVTVTRRDGQRAVVPSLLKTDLRVFDNGREMPIATFDVGTENMTRPIALWLIIQCTDEQPEGHHSGFMREKTMFLKAGLEHLGADDQVGIAHWCDNGEESIDMGLKRDPGSALNQLDALLHRAPVTGTQTRNGELAMQRMIEQVLRTTDEAHTHLQPILIFLYGDRSGTHGDEADHILDDLLMSSARVYGLNYGKWYDVPSVVDSPHSESNGMPNDLGATRTPSFQPDWDGKAFHLVHVYSSETGGTVLSVPDPRQFGQALDGFVTELQSRYTIGFKPRSMDGKRHRLEVELTPSARKRLGKVEIRTRREYIPTANR